MIKYTFFDTNDQECKGEILSLLTVLSRAGLDCSFIDSSSMTILQHALSQYDRSDVHYFPNTSVANMRGVLCYAQEMFITRGMLNDLWMSGILTKITELPRSSVMDISWKVVFKALVDAIPMIFSTTCTDFILYYIEGIMKLTIRQLGMRPMYPPAVNLIIRILLLSKKHNMNWGSFSLICLERALEAINTLRLKRYKDFWRLCSLWSTLSPNSFGFENWTGFISSASTTQKCQSPHDQVEISQGMRFDAMLKALGLSWVPGFIVAARFGAENMNEADLTKYVNKFGEGKFLENVVRSISLVVEKTAKYCNIKDLTRCISTAIISTTKLLRRIRKVSNEFNKDFLYEECVRFCNFIHKKVIPDSIISALCGYMRVLFSLVEDYDILSKFFDTLDRNEDYDNAFLLGELCFYISKCPKERVPVMSQKTIEILISSGSKNIRRAAKGLSTPQNIAATYAVAETWAHKGDTYRGANVYYWIVSNLPRDLNTFEFVIANIKHAKLGLLCTKLDKLLLRIFKSNASKIKKDKIKTWHETIIADTGAYHFTELKFALQEVNKGPEEAFCVHLPEGDRTNEMPFYDKDKLVSYLMTQIKRGMNDNIDILSSLVELDTTFFMDILFAGELDSIITSLIKNKCEEDIKDMTCRYVEKILADLKDAEYNSESWKKGILACSLIDVLDKEVMMYITDEQLIQFLARTIHNFVQRWKDSKTQTISPPATLYDLYIIMRVIVIALFDHNGTTLDDPDIAKLITGIYDAYNYVILPQNLEAASTITRCLSQESDERSVAEGKLRAFLAAQITGGFSDLEIFGKSFVRTLVSLEFTLARKFTGILFPLPQASEGETDTRRMGRIQDLSIYRMCQLHESPELTLRVALNFIMTAGVNSAYEFYWVHNGLCSLISDWKHNVISDELRCLALRGVTTLIVNACIHDTREERIRHILDPAVYSNKRGYGLHRAKMINDSYPLEEIIFLAHEEYTEVLSNPEDIKSRSTSLSPLSSPQLLSPKDEMIVALELKRRGARSLNGLIESFFNYEYEREVELGTQFGYDPLPISELSKKRTFHWKGLNISVAISNLMIILEGIFKLQELMDRQGDLQLTNLQCEAVHSLVTLSDVLVPAQSMWMLDICTQLFELVSTTTVDFMLIRNLTIGILKSAAQTNSTSPHTVDAINRVICQSLLSEHTTVRSGVLIGVRFLMQSGNRDTFLPSYLVHVIMNHITGILYTDQPENDLLYAISAGFDVIQNFPRCSEEFGFTESFITGAVALCRDPKSSSGVVKHIYKGLRLLLLCDTIDQSKRILIEEFALRALDQNTIHSNLSMGLLFTAMYARKDAFSLYASKRRSPKTEEIRKFHAIFAYIKHQSGSDSQLSSPKLVDILAQMLEDLLTPERGLEVVFKELSSSQSQPGAVRTIARVMNTILSAAEDKNTIFDAVNAGITNFIKNPNKIWLATCVLLSISSDDKLLYHLFVSLLYNDSNKDILTFAGREALRRLSPSNGDKLKITLKMSYNVDL